MSRRSAVSREVLVKEYMRAVKEGLTLPELADSLGMPTQHLSGRLVELRRLVAAEGVTLPKLKRATSSRSENNDKALNDLVAFAKEN